MAPLNADTPVNTETISAPITVPVKAVPETTETKPKVRRVIDEEGGTTTASVIHTVPILALELISQSIHTIFQPGTMARNTLLLNHLFTLNMGKMQIQPLRTF